MRIIFMGTPEFAVPSLEILVKYGYDVVGVITAPDKPAGRGQKNTHSPVKEAALKLGLNILQPEKLKNPEFLDQLRALKADLQVVVAFRMLPEVVWAMPSFGTFNLHASLLPQYRGAAPINWAIINGETQTGATTFFLQQEIDTGNIILQEYEDISQDDTAGTLYERLMHKGAHLVLQTVQAIDAGGIITRSQPESTEELKAAPKIFRETCQVNFSQTVEQVYNFIRGLSPYPAAWALLNGKTYKIYKATPVKAENDLAPGQVNTDNSTYLHIGCNNGYIEVLELQAEGKKRLPVAEYFRGNKI